VFGSGSGCCPTSHRGGSGGDKDGEVVGVVPAVLQHSQAPLDMEAVGLAADRMTSFITVLLMPLLLPLAVSIAIAIIIGCRLIAVFDKIDM